MKENKKQEELQSRRQFFKKAAKGALPILGAIALSQMPVLGNAATPAGDCRYGCSYGCSGSCKGLCYTGCSGSCDKSCYSGCRTSSKSY